MSVQYHMRAWHTGLSQYVDWVVNDSPDLTGEYYPGGSTGLTNITINKKVPSKVINYIKPLNSVDGTVFHINSYDWLKPQRTSSDTDSSTDPISVPTLNTGIGIVRGTANGSTPRDYASLYWNESQGTFILGFTTNELETLSSTKPFISGHLSIIEGDEDGYLSITNNSKLPATTGVIRVPNAEKTVGRNHANDGNVEMIHVDNLDRVVLGSISDIIYIPSNLRVDGYIVFGDPSVASQSGYLRVDPNKEILVARNTGNSDDLTLLSSLSDDLLIGENNVLNIRYNSNNEHLFFQQNSQIISIGETDYSYLKFYSDNFNPTIEQINTTSGNGQNFNINAQTTLDGYGGSLIISSGEGSGAYSDGYVDVRTGGIPKIRVFSNGTPATSDFPLNISENPNSILLFNNTVRFYDIGADVNISFDNTSDATGNDFYITGQSATTVGGKLIIESGDGSTSPGDVEINTGALNGVLITQDGYGFIRSYLPGLFFESTLSENSFGSDKVLITQEENSTLNYNAAELWLSAQTATDGYGGSLVLSSGNGNVPLTDDGDIIFRIGMFPVARYFSVNGYSVHRIHSDLVQLDGDLLVNGTTTTVNSTIVDIADRVIHVNHSSGDNDPLPLNITGFSVHRGSVGGVNRDHSSVIWDESDNSGIWKLASIDEGDDSTLVNTQPILVNYLITQSSPNVTELNVPSIGGLRTLNNSVAVSARNNAANADLELLSTDTLNNILHGNSNVANQNFNVDLLGSYNFNVDGYLSVKISNDGYFDYVSFGSSPSTIGNIRVEQESQETSDLFTVRNALNNNDLLIIGVDGYDGIIFGDDTISNHIFNSASFGIYDFKVNNASALKISNDGYENYIALGENTALAGIIRVEQEHQFPSNIIKARNYAGSDDLLIVGVDGYDNIVHGDISTVNHLFNVNAFGVYNFNVNGYGYVQIGSDSSSDYVNFGTLPSTTGNIRTSQTYQTQSSIITARDVADTVDQMLLGVDGYGKALHGDVNTAGHTITSKDGYNIDIIIGSQSVHTSTVDKSIFKRGLRRSVAYVSQSITISDSDGYHYIAVNSAPGSLTVSLPASPSEGDTYEFKDVGHAGTLNSWTLSGNGFNIDGYTDITVNQDYQNLIVTYIGGIENQWFIT